MIRIIILIFIGYFLFKGANYLMGEVFSDTKKCPRCKGKGWWQNTRNRDTCEWCKGSGRLPKDFPT